MLARSFSGGLPRRDLLKSPRLIAVSRLHRQLFRQSELVQPLPEDSMVKGISWAIGACIVALIGYAVLHTKSNTDEPKIADTVSVKDQVYAHADPNFSF